MECESVDEETHIDKSGSNYIQFQETSGNLSHLGNIGRRGSGSSLATTCINTSCKHLGYILFQLPTCFSPHQVEINR